MKFWADNISKLFRLELLFSRLVPHARSSAAPERRACVFKSENRYVLPLEFSVKSRPQRALRGTRENARLKGSRWKINFRMNYSRRGAPKGIWKICPRDSFCVRGATEFISSVQALVVYFWYGKACNTIIFSRLFDFVEWGIFFSRHSQSLVKKKATTQSAAGKGANS